MTKEIHIARTALDPIKVHAAKNSGTVTEIADRLTKITGKKVHRQQVQTWLNSDGNKQPRLGMGLMLMQVGYEIMGTAFPQHFHAKTKTAKR